MLQIINTIMKKTNTPLLIDYILNEETRQYITFLSS